MITLDTHCTFLQNELLDVARLFKARPEIIVHRYTRQYGAFFNAFTVYPAKGLKGSRNSNFYEFLTTIIFHYSTFISSFAHNSSLLFVLV